MDVVRKERRCTSVVLLVNKRGRGDGEGLRVYVLKTGVDRRIDYRVEMTIEVLGSRCVGLFKKFVFSLRW